MESEIAEFNKKEYYKKLITPYQKLEFHKDNEPEKFSVNEVDSNSDYHFFRHLEFRTRKSSIDFTAFMDCLEDFSKIVTYFKMLVPNISLLEDGVSVDKIIKETLTIFSQRIEDKEVTRIKKLLNENLKFTLALIN